MFLSRGTRASEIAWAGLSLAVHALAAHLRRGQRARDAIPRRVRITLESLGPTFVKLGQALSQRRDLLPIRYILELSHLQQNAPGFDPGLAIQQIETGLGAKLEELFSDFQREPVGAASMAQVHRARLKDGREVVVKVLRPGIRQQVDRDMRILLVVVWFVARIVPRLARQQPARLVHELWSNLKRETDLVEESANIRRFVAVFRDSDTVHIPDVPPGLNAQAVLVQEFSAGRHLDDDDVVKTDGPRVARILIDAYLKQLFGTGFFHADPHPGNLFVMADGRLCLLDFGVVGFLDLGSRRALASFVQAVSHQDPAWVIEAALELGLLSANADLGGARRKIEPILADFAAASVGTLSLGSLFVAIAGLGAQGSLSLPTHLAVLVRTLFTAEGTLRRLDPALNMLDAFRAGDQADIKTSLAGDKGLAHMRWEVALIAQSLPDVAAGVLGHARRSHGLARAIGLAEADPAAERLGRAADRMAVALVTLGLYIAASLLMQHSIGPTIFNVPLLAAAGYLLAIWFTLKLVRAIARTGGL